MIGASSSDEDVNGHHEKPSAPVPEAREESEDEDWPSPSPPKQDASASTGDEWHSFASHMFTCSERQMVKGCVVCAGPPLQGATILEDLLSLPMPSTLDRLPSCLGDEGQPGNVCVLHAQSTQQALSVHARQEVCFLRSS